ncbi:MAG: hypothetical protein AAGD11_17195 [Planctomycetota bacterium]
MHLEIGKSYIWIFWIFFGVFVVLTFASSELSIAIPACLLPFFMGFMLYSQIRSKVALDSWWRATHPAGTRTYTALIIWNTLGVIGMTVMAFLFVQKGF